MLPHPVAVAADVDDVAVMEETNDQGGGHDVVAQDLTPFVEGSTGSLRFFQRGHHVSERAVVDASVRSG